MKLLRAILAALCLLALSCGNADAFFITGGAAGPTPPPSITLPSANLQAIYSMVRYSTWPGNCIRVQRASDNTQTDIGFVNGIMDITTALSFGDGSAVHVVTLYDQSGNGNDATATSGTSGPLIVSANTLNNMPGATFWLSGMVLPSGVSVSSQNVTVFTVVALDVSTNSDSQWELNTVWTSGLNLIQEPNNDQVLDNSNFRMTGVYPYSQAAGVTVVTSSASSKTYQFNETLVTGLPASFNTTMTGGGIFKPIDLAYGGYGEFYLMAIYNTALGQTTIQTNKNNLYATFNVPRTYISRVLWDGDSITLGTGSTNGINNPRQTQPLLTKNTYFRNIGVFGQLMTQMASTEAANVSGSYDSSLTKNILVIDGGTNDMCSAGSANGTTLWTSTLSPYITAAKTAGYTVDVGTVIYNNACTSGGAQDLQRQAYNSLIRSNASSMGYSVIDYDAITQLQSPQTPGYSADGVHPTTLGYGLMAAAAAAVLNAQLP